LGILDPLTSLIIAFCFLGVLIYKRVNLGITLNAAALLLALLALDFSQIGRAVFQTTTDPSSVSIVVASFGIMLLSLLYKETGFIDVLSESLSKLVNNSKLIVSLLPAVIGLLPVSGGALMSAPLVETEANNLGLEEDKKTYVNLWFRHTIFPVYPVSPVLIMTSSLTAIALTSIILRQIPVVIIMIVVGYFFGLRKTPKTKAANVEANRNTELKRLIITFSPILATIIAVVAFNIDVAIAAFIGVIALLIITRPNLKTAMKPFKNWGLWGITAAAYGAFLLKNVTSEMQISQLFQPLVNGSLGMIILLTLVPAFLGAITGSPAGGVAITVSILAGIVAFTPSNAALLYITSYLGYLVSPTHLCLLVTADYFNCSFRKLYKYLLPSLVISFATAILVYLLL
jgi:integral membrane protein (TIGR00529 family)